MKIFKSFFRIINSQTIIVTMLAILATYFSREYNITGEFPLTLIGIAIVFPIVFSINGAYKRRERVLDQYGIIKAHGRALYFASRDWVGKTDEKFQNELKTILRELFFNIKHYFDPASSNEHTEEEEMVYRTFSKLSQYIKKFRKRDIASGEVSRSNQYASKMMVAFEQMKHIYQYRTPQTLRSYSKVFIYILPIIYGPHFAEISKGFSPGLWVLMPVLFSVILVSLDNVQDQLENPYDRIGEDDVMINAEKFADLLD